MRFSLFRSRQERPDNMLPEGWQFYSRPTNLEPPGTIFRVDSNGKRFIHDRLSPKIERGAEPGSQSTTSIETKLSALARLVGIDGWGAEAKGGRTAVVEFEIGEPVRECITDTAMDAVLVPYLKIMAFKTGNRYFVIREVRTARRMKYLLTNSQLGEIGGDAAIQAAVEVGVKVSASRAGVRDLTQEFPERLGVMFLPDEIAPVQALAGAAPELGRFPVRGVLDWDEGEVDARGPSSP